MEKTNSAAEQRATELYRQAEAVRLQPANGRYQQKRHRMRALEREALQHMRRSLPPLHIDTDVPF
jgi:hypothetical protein